MLTQKNTVRSLGVLVFLEEKIQAKMFKLQKFKMKFLLTSFDDFVFVSDIKDIDLEI